MIPLRDGWSEILARSEVAREQGERFRIPVPRVDEGLLVATVECARTADSARELVRVFRSLDLRAVAIEVVCDPQPGLDLGEGRVWHDVRAKAPRYVALTAITGTPHMIRAVLDVRVPAVLVALEEILRLDTTWVAHDVKQVLHGLWALGLDPELRQIYDTYLAAACLNLGEFNKRDATADVPDEVDRIEAEKLAVEDRAFHLSLGGQCRHHGLPAPSSLSAVPHVELTDKAALALAGITTSIACLYLRQRSDPGLIGLDGHLCTVEFPFALANARIEWNGVQIGEAERLDLREAVEKAAAYHAATLVRFGVDPPGSTTRFRALLSRLELWPHFLRDHRVSLEDDVLEAVEHLHPAIGAFRYHRRFTRLASEPWILGAMTGADGRVHPIHQQLGAATGRNTCSSPNIAGIGRMLRPVVVAPPGMALMEFDYAQVEVGIAAASYGDRDLIRAFNSGDVYAAMAQRFYVGKLSPAERAMAPIAFKRARPELRDAIKVFVLGVLYGMSPDGIATRFSINIQAARREQERFLDLFPALKARLAESVAYGFARGSATIVTGLRREIGQRGANDRWVANYLRNTPIQGAAAVLFKLAVIRLDRTFRGTTTKLVLPLHDAVLVECLYGERDAVAEQVARVMRDVMREMYPVLEPRVDVNKSAPWCWNKDGHWDSLKRFLDDPGFKLGGKVVPPVDAAPEGDGPFDLDMPADGTEFGPRRGADTEFAEVASHA